MRWRRAEWRLARDLTAGSIWRRWDLHVHTPDTLHSDLYESWEAYLDALEVQTAVRIMGVCDYLIIENYKRMLDFHTEGRIKNIDLLIPNIEFRVGPMADTTAGLNMHLLISPDTANHVEEIERALQELHVEYRNRRYPCTKATITELGYAIDRTISPQHPHIALEAGARQFKVVFGKFRDWYQSNKWLSH